MSVIIRLQNLPMSANASDIRKFFTGLSIPEGGVRIVGGEMGDAFIAFSTDEDARKAMLLDHQLINAVPIRLLLSSKNEMQSITESAQSNAMFAMKQVDNRYDSTSAPPSNQYPPNFAIPKEYDRGGSEAATRPQSDSVMPRDTRSQWDYPEQDYNMKHNYPPKGNQQSHEFYDYGNNNFQTGPSYGGAAQPEQSHGGQYYEHNQPQSNQRGPQNFQYDQRYGHDEQYPYNDAQQRETHADPRTRRQQQSPPRNDHFAYFEAPKNANRSPDNSFKRSHEPDNYESNDYGKRRFDDSRIEDRVVRLSVTPKDISIKSLFEFLKGVTIVSKYGVRIEEDYSGRVTGYIYILTNDEASYQKILEKNGQHFQNRPIIIIPSSIKDFYAVNDPSFLKKCPKNILAFLPPPHLKFVSPFCRDGCLEMSDLPMDSSEGEIISFLGAPGLEPRDVSIIPHPESGTARSVVRLPTSEDLKILLSARPRPFRSNQNLGPVRIIPISLVQYKHMCGETRQRQDVYNQPPSRDDNNRFLSTCLLLNGLNKSIPISEFKRSIRSAYLTDEDIVTTAEGDMYISCKSESDCSKVFMELSNPRSFIKKHGSAIRLKRVTKDQFEKFNTKRNDHSVASVPMTHEGGNCNYPERPYPPKRDGPPRDFNNSIDHRQPMNGDRMRPPMSRDMSVRPPMPMDDRRFGWVPRMPRRDMNYKPQGHGTTVHLHISNVPLGVATGRLAEHFRKFNPIFSSIRVYPGARGPAAQIAFSNPRDAEAVMHYVKNCPLDGSYMIARYDRDFHAW